jgi:hypothetical protein
MHQQDLSARADDHEWHAVPPTVIIGGTHDLRAADELGFPMVLKVPDSVPFARRQEGRQPGRFDAPPEWLKETDLLLAQAFMPTNFDWRVGVLGGKPLFVCQYLMAKKHWQIVKHRSNGRPLEGAANTMALGEAPPAVIDVGLRSAQLIGDGLYGVDIKETEHGIFVVEVNDNPNIEHGVEDSPRRTRSGSADPLVHRLAGRVVGTSWPRRRAQLKRVPGDCSAHHPPSWHLPPTTFVFLLQRQKGQGPRFRTASFLHQETTTRRGWPGQAWSRRGEHGDRSSTGMDTTPAAKPAGALRHRRYRLWMAFLRPAALVVRSRSAGGL